MNIPLPDGAVIDLARPLVMGVLNVTPDSFSDGGRYDRPEAALACARAMIEAGAELIDIGGESTRPGAEPVAAAEQCRRILPVIELLARELAGEVARQGGGGAENPPGGEATGGVWISVDTADVEVAAAALDAGATIINDVTAGRGDEGMFALAAARGCPIILMHMQGTPRTMQDEPRYGDVVAEVRDFLLSRRAAAVAAGIDPARIILDPGIGFGKTYEHNMQLLCRLDALAALRQPLLLGVSRKRVLARACQLGRKARGGGSDSPPPQELDGATAGVTALAVAAGVHILRVHEVSINRQAADVAWQVRQALGSLP